MKRKSLIDALAKKLGSGSDSFNVLIHQFKRRYPIYLGLAQKVVNAESRIGTDKEPSDEEIASLVIEILKA